MKLESTKKWYEKNVTNEPDCDIGAGSPEGFMRSVIDSHIKNLVMQTSYSDCASMPIPLYEKTKELIKELQAQLSAKDAIIAELQKENEWQDIESAPRDGTEIQVAKYNNSLGAWVCKIAYWTDAYGDTYKWVSDGNSTDDLFLAKTFSHWKKIEPPKGI